MWTLGGAARCSSVSVCYRRPQVSFCLSDLGQKVFLTSEIPTQSLRLTCTLVLLPSFYFFAFDGHVNPN